MSKEPQWSSEKSETQRYDVEKRTLKFSMACIDLCKLVKNDTVNAQLISQLILSAGSRGANYREANDSIHKKDFYYRMGIRRRES
jgi:four helix bundle protein